MTGPIRFATRPISRWPNGAGRKADIAEGPGWMVSVAWLDADAPFSHFPDTDRTITLLDGPGFTLTIAGRGEMAVTQPWQPAAFDGAAATTCRIHGGPCQVLNVMTMRGTVQHRVTVRAWDGALEAGPGLAVLLRGAAAGGGAALGALDALWLDAPVQFEGAGVLWHVRIDPVERVGAAGGTAR